MNDNGETPPESELSPLPDDNSSKDAVPPEQPGAGDASPNLDGHDRPKILVTEEDKELLKMTQRRKIPPKIAPIKNTFETSSSFLARNDVTSPNKANFLILTVAAIFGLIATYVYSRQLPMASEPTPQLVSYEAELKKMQTKYVNQTDRFWTTFLASHETILNMHDPDTPAVIMLTIPEGHRDMALCFAQHHAEVLDELLGGKNSEFSQPSYVDGEQLSAFDADRQKVKLDEAIKNIYENNQRAVIINNLEQLHPEAVRFFHGICDNFEAKYKDIAILFILEVPEESELTKDRDVYVHLYKLWSQLEPGTINALLARLANNVAIMQRVNHFTC